MSLKKQLDAYKTELESLTIPKLKKIVESSSVAKEYIADSNTGSQSKKMLIHALVFAKCRTIANTTFYKCINNS